MGYYIDQLDSDFYVKKENIPQMLAAIKEIPDQNKYAWVVDASNCTNITDAMDFWRWDISFDEEGNIDGIEFNGQKAGDDDVLFRAIAPFVEADSYIEMKGEEDARWQWRFDGKECEEVFAQITWPD